MRIAHVQRDELSVSEGVHGGAGHLLIKGLWGEGDFRDAVVVCPFCDFAARRWDWSSPSR